VTLREEHRVWVFGNRVLRRIFRPKMDEIIRVWRKLHNEELHNSYSSPSIIRTIKSKRMRCIGQVNHVEEKTNSFRFSVGNLEGKRSLGRPKRRWDDDIEMEWY
jgi:hypothetical protein